MEQREKTSVLYFLKNRIVLNKIFTLFVIVYPLTSMYASPIRSVSIGDVIILLLIPIMSLDMLARRRKIIFSAFWIYAFYTLIITIFWTIVFCIMSSSFGISSAVNRMIRDAFFLVTIIVFGNVYFNFEYGEKILRKFCVLLGILIIAQSVSYKFLGIYIPGVIPQLTTTISGRITGSEYNSIFLHKAQVYGYVRSSGFLAEPTIVGQVVSVALLLELFNDGDRINKVLVVFYTLIMILTLSPNSYVGLFTCIALWMIFGNKNNRKGILNRLILCIVLVLGLLFLSLNSETSSIFERFRELTYRTDGSTVIRVLRGIFFYINMPLLYQLFGSGFGNFLQFKEITGVTSIYELAYEHEEYMNTNAYIMVSAGFIGFLLFVFAIFYCGRGRLIVSRMIAILLLVFGLSCSIYSTPQFMIMMLFIMYSPKENLLSEDKYYYVT